MSSKIRAFILGTTAMAALTLLASCNARESSEYVSPYEPESNIIPTPVHREKSPEKQKTPSQPKASALQVRIDNFTFGPAALSIAPGTTVTWTNHDDVPHTVKSTTGLFKSETLDTDQSFSYTFDKPGKYAYFCTVHTHMTGEILVK